MSLLLVIQKISSILIANGFFHIIASLADGLQDVFLFPHFFLVSVLKINGIRNQIFFVINKEIKFPGIFIYFSIMTLHLFL